MVIDKKRGIGSIKIFLHFTVAISTPNYLHSLAQIFNEKHLFNIGC